jgi:hypothetical protein
MPIDALYNLVVQNVSPLMHSRIFWNAVMLGIGVACIALAAIRMFGFRQALGLLIACVFGLIAFGIGNRNVDARVKEKANAISDVAINAGVAKAQEAHATQLQLIHANVSVAGFEVQECQRTVNYKDFCSSSTPYTTWREINVHYVEHESCSTDTDGHESCTTTTTRESDDEWTPWFTYVVRYYIVADTKVKYLYQDGLYDIANKDEPKGKPKVYLTDWRAPEDALNHIYRNERPGKYDERIPQIWAEVRNHASNGGDAVLATFVGKYFHWLHADESAQYAVYNGHYERMKTMVIFPGPQGNTLTVKNGYGKEVSVKSDLLGNDGPSLDYHPITDLAGINPGLLDQLNVAAENLQGHAGPNLQASIRWFIVKKSVVEKMGGEVETTQALKAYLADESVWGLFSLPKNEVIELIVVNDSATCIAGRNMETGMPFGNVLVMQDHRMSIAADECIPFTPENAIGKIDGRYTNNDLNNLTYSYPDLTQAGGAAALLYQKTPGYVVPDPNSEECSNTPPEHHGFIRFSMCTQEYRRSNIEMDENDVSLIVSDAIKSAKEQTNIALGIILLIVGIMAIIAMMYFDRES